MTNQEELEGILKVIQHRVGEDEYQEIACSFGAMSHEEKMLRLAWILFVVLNSWPTKRRRK